MKKITEKNAKKTRKIKNKEWFLINSKSGIISTSIFLRPYSQVLFINNIWFHSGFYKDLILIFCDVISVTFFCFSNLVLAQKFISPDPTFFGEILNWQKFIDPFKTNHLSIHKTHK